MPKRSVRRGSARKKKSLIKLTRSSSRLRGGEPKPAKVLPDALELSFPVYRIPYQKPDYECPKPFKRVDDNFKITYDTTDDEDFDFEITQDNSNALTGKTIDKVADASRHRTSYKSYRVNQDFDREHYNEYVYCEYSPSGKYRKSRTDIQRLHHIKFNKADDKIDCLKHYNQEESTIPDIFNNQKVKELCGVK
jgi:hypothetical protein